MQNKFLEYSIEQLLENKNFIGWVLRDQNKKEWGKFLDKYPTFRPKAAKAREIILLLRDKYDVLDENSILELWHNIDLFNQQHKRKVHKFRHNGALGWAASFFLIICIGTLTYLYLNRHDNNYHWFTSSDLSEINEARMVLSTGDEIDLGKDNSTISIIDTEKQVIVNDSIIDLSPKEKTRSHKVEMNEVVIPYGKKSELLLSDGTKVWLNAGSRLAFPSKFTKNKREVFLEGEACFKVIKNEVQPFIVKTVKVNVKVLGTYFNVSAFPTDETIETVLLNGSVAVTSSKAFGLAKKETILQGKQRASFDKEKNEVAVSEEPNAELYIAWTYGWLEYHRESLKSVLDKLERYYNVKFQLSPDYPVTDKISGKLDLKESLEDVMMVLADASGIEYRILDNKIYIERKIKKLHRR